LSPLIHGTIFVTAAQAARGVITSATAKSAAAFRRGLTWLAARRSNARRAR
jgi:hypothetical protein